MLNPNVEVFLGCDCPLAAGANGAFWCTVRLGQPLTVRARALALLPFVMNRLA